VNVVNVYIGRAWAQKTPRRVRSRRPGWKYYLGFSKGGGGVGNYLGGRFAKRTH